MNTTQPNRTRIPSKPIILPEGEAWFSVTDPAKPENKFDPANPVWSIKVKWSPEERKAVEQLLGPLLPEALEAKKAELLDEAQRAGDKIKEKRVDQMEYETPWREVLSRETGEPTGELELVLKRSPTKFQRGSQVKVVNSPVLVVDASLKPTAAPIPNRARVIVKMATWPVYFAKDNKVGIKRNLEAIQIVAMPAARTPDTQGFAAIEDGYSSDEVQHQDTNGGDKAASGTDY